MSNAPNTYIELRKQRDFSENIGAGFVYVRQNWRSLFRSILLMSVPFLLLGTVLISSFVKYLINISTGGANAPLFIAYVILGYFILLLALFVESVVVHEHMRFLLIHGTQPTTGQLWKQMRSQLFIYFGLSLITAFIQFIGQMMFWIPGLFCAVAFTLVYPLRAFQRLSFGDCISTSFNLVWGNWWRSFALQMTLASLVACMAFAVTSPFGLLSGFLTMSGMDEMADPASRSMSMLIFGVVTGFVLFLSFLLLLPLMQCSYGMHILSIWEKKNGTGLMERVENMVFTDASPASTTKA